MQASQRHVLSEQVADSLRSLHIDLELPQVQLLNRVGCLLRDGLTYQCKLIMTYSAFGKVNYLQGRRASNTLRKNFCLFIRQMVVPNYQLLYFTCFRKQLIFHLFEFYLVCLILFDDDFGWL